MFRFEHIDHLGLLVAIPALYLLLWRWQHWRTQTLQSLGQPERLIQPVSWRLFWWKNGLLAVAIGFMAFAWANPQRGMKKQTVTQESADVFIALDISNSMLCEDIAPSRLELSKIFAEKLIKSLAGERIGLIFFAGNAFLQMPLSTDYGFTLETLRSANTDLMTEQGTAIPAAVDLASKSYDPSPGGGRAIIIITDGENHDEEAINRVEEAFDDGIVVFTVGAGTENGGPIPMDHGGQGQYKRDEKGEIVMTHLDGSMLKKLAAAGGGNAYNVGQGERAINALTKSVGGLEKRAMEVRSFSEFESWYQWFLLPALLLLFIDLFLKWTKKTAVLSGLILIFIHPLSAQKAHEQMLKGDDLYRGEQYSEAAKAYKSAKEQSAAHPNAAYNLGNALYEQGNYEEAGTAFQESANQAKTPLYKADALHNQGNALLKQNKYKEAVEAYTNSLRLRPGDAGTKVNLQIAKKKLKEEQQRQQEQQKKQDQEKQDQQQNQQPKDNQQQPNQPQNKNEKPKQGQEQPNNQEQEGEQSQKPGQMKPGEARQLLETAIKPEDQRNARKYRAKQQQQPQNKKSKKDW